MITEVTKSLQGIQIKAVQMHDLAPFKASGLIGCGDKEGDIVGGLLCIKSPSKPIKLNQYLIVLIKLLIIT